MTLPPITVKPTGGPVGAQWFAIVDDRTGELVSTCTVLAKPTDLQVKGCTAIPIAREPDFAREQWDPSTKTLVPRAPEPPASTCPSCGRDL